MVVALRGRNEDDVCGEFSRWGKGEMEWVGRTRGR